ncbi:MAG TPA: SRPBCC family protein [Rubrobacteraceae bacterium]|nr:SRPBCC family protein [Rubrobacteraceae bacterium]
MKLENEFTVDAPVDEAWEVMLDLERVTPCLPGATLTEQEGDEYRGKMTVRLGPVKQEYNGTVRFEETDEENQRAVLKASGKDQRGQGTASATITSTMSEENGGTKVKVETDMQLTGRAAQFGRGVQQDVAAKLLSQFADCLEKEILGENVQEEPEPAAASSNGAGSEESEEEPPVRKIQQESEVEPLDLGAASYEAVMKRAAPVAIGLVVLFGVVWILRRRRR